jgi:hypothetical protein
MSSFLIKAPPQRFDVGERPIFIERTFFDGETVSPGAEAFVWFTETKGGAGLAYVGTIYSASSMNEIHAKRWRVAVTIRSVATGLTDADLEPYFEARTNSPISTLGFKLFRHPHDKICALTLAEADFLRTFETLA